MPVGVQCPISSSLVEFPSYWDCLWCPGLSPVLVSIALPFTFHSWCFPFALIYHWISIVFLLYGRRAIDPSWKAQKRSILIPVIKREGLDPTDPGNFRPIANVSFISKVVEKIIAYQLL